MNMTVTSSEVFIDLLVVTMSTFHVWMRISCLMVTALFTVTMILLDSSGWFRLMVRRRRWNLKVVMRWRWNLKVVMGMKMVSVMADVEKMASVTT